MNNSLMKVKSNCHARYVGVGLHGEKVLLSLLMVVLMDGPMNWLLSCCWSGGCWVIKRSLHH